MSTSNVKKFRTFLFEEYFNGFSVSNLKELEKIYSSDNEYAIEALKSYSEEFNISFDETKNEMLSVINIILSNYN